MKAHLFDGHAQLLQHLEALLLILLTRHPEAVSVLHDVCQNSATQEHHVLATRGVLDTDLEFLRGKEKRLMQLALYTPERFEHRIMEHEHNMLASFLCRPVYIAGT